MEIAVLIAIITCLGLVSLFLLRRRSNGEMYIKRQHQIQSFPPDHLKHRR
ncbi:hypothetical protein Turpa_3557 [Turneriella parva DSM 21527]|uniref:Uncharacterized protein n=1 Tax=Turneriella parva (strain ATCC BAA-1111 / DSM 21527 / NCTC 11395 / H) TaxID=869212 RepID=I4BA85_TURPD|nr:hypothetical protein Turpa_3557 [Turneriella parva DSM 21527]